MKTTTQKTTTQKTTTQQKKYIYFLCFMFRTQRIGKWENTAANQKIIKSKPQTYKELTKEKYNELRTYELLFNKTIQVFSFLSDKVEFLAIDDHNEKGGTALEKMKLQNILNDFKEFCKIIPVKEYTVKELCYTDAEWKKGTDFEKQGVQQIKKSDLFFTNIEWSAMELQVGKHLIKLETPETADANLANFIYDNFQGLFNEYVRDLIGERPKGLKRILKKTSHFADPVRR